MLTKNSLLKWPLQNVQLLEATRVKTPSPPPSGVRISSLKSTPLPNQDKSQAHFSLR